MPKVKLLDEQTICATATPSGEGGIHMVRLSGKDALAIATQIFRLGKRGQTPLDPKGSDPFCPNTVRYGYVVDGEKKIDEAMLAYFKAPNTYTREDIVEMTIHGNYLIANTVLQLMIRKGARLAEPGEFTKRAFLNGRIDLAQAEAVLSLISAKTELSSRVALDQLDGKMSSEIQVIKEQLVDILAEVEAFVDFPEEDIEVYTNEEVGVKMVEIIKKIQKILSTYEKGEVLRDGIPTVIVGKPNVGKSSLLNMLLGRDRAIVSDIPGTTRDSLEELLDIQGILFRIVDTAGLREGKDPIEKLGIERTKNYLEAGRLFIFMLDNGSVLSEDDRQIYKQIKDREHLIVVNKGDLNPVLDKKELASWKQGEKVIEISTLQKTGIDVLESALVHSVWQGKVDAENIVLTSQRQFEALTRALVSLQKAKEAFQNRLSLEFLAFDLRESLQALGEVVGEVCSDDILSVIFSKFCIGK